MIAASVAREQRGSAVGSGEEHYAAEIRHAPVRIGKHRRISTGDPRSKSVEPLQPFPAQFFEIGAGWTNYPQLKIAETALAGSIVDTDQIARKTLVHRYSQLPSKLP